MPEKIKVTVVGLEFGAEFISIYQRYPDAECWAVCQRTEVSLSEIGDEFGRAIIEKRESVADAERAANWTMTGICAHALAMRGGERIEIPRVEKRQVA